MKKALNQTIIVFVAVNLITAGFAFAQDVPEENVKEAKKEALKQTEAARREATIPLDLARKEVDALRRRLEVTQRQMGAAQKQMAIAQGHASHDMLLDTLVAQVNMPLWQQSSGAVLVIPAAQMKLEDLAAITTDMSIMSRIFDKKLSQARLTTGRGGWFVGIDSLSFGRDSRTTEAIYLEGYGALFLMKVNVLLSAPPETQQEKETEEEDTDPLWTETIQEMYAPQEVNRRRRGDRPEEEYDAEKVAELKETLIKTLKHAANIRGLKPDESVILTVIGSGVSSNVDKIVMNKNNQLLVHTKDRNIVQILGSPPLSDLGISSPTVLTIRAKKADIDTFANGTLSFDQFTQKTLLLSYSYLGGNIGGGPSRSFPTNMLLRRDDSSNSRRGYR